MEITYEEFLETKEAHKDVKITCVRCGKNCVVSSDSLLARKTINLEQICNYCMRKSARNTLHGSYYDIHFDSSYELSFIHMCLIKHIPLKRCSFSIPYKFKGESRSYYPDFSINKTIIEIKGKFTEECLVKAQAAEKFCHENGLRYEMLSLKELKKIPEFIHITKVEQLYIFNQNQLKITSYPSTWKTAEHKASDVGFCYVRTNLLTGIKICNYILTNDFSQEFITSLKESNEKIDVVGYADNEYNLLKMAKRINFPRNRAVMFKRKNNVRSQAEREHMSKRKKQDWENMPNKERELFKERMSNAVKGTKNPNYGNKWTDEQKKKLSEKRKANGKSLGRLNGMYGKNGANAINGKKVYLYDENSNLIKEFASIKHARKELGLSNFAFKKCAKKDVNNAFILKQQDVQNNINLSQHKKYYAFDEFGNVIKIFNSQKELKQELEKQNLNFQTVMKHHKGNGIFYSDSNIFDPAWVNEIKHQQCYTIYAYKNDELVKTFYNSQEAMEFFNIDNRTLKKFISSEQSINGYVVKYDDHANEMRKSISEKHVKPKRNITYRYKVNLIDLSGNVVQTFNNVGACAKHFSVSLKTINNSIKTHTPLNDFFIDYDEEGKKNMEELCKKRAETARNIKNKSYKAPRSIYYVENVLTHEKKSYDYIDDLINEFNISYYLLRKLYINKDKLLQDKFKIASQKLKASKNILKVDANTNSIVEVFKDAYDAARSLNLSTTQFSPILANSININGFVYIYKNDFKE